MAPFPLIKLVSVFLKQLSKPLANQIKTRAKSSDFFKTYVSTNNLFNFANCSIEKKRKLFV